MMQDPVPAAELDWFFCALVGLQRIETSSEPGDIRRFRSDRLELRIKMSADPIIERIACRAVFEVPSLDAAAALLIERAYPFVETRGLRATERSLTLFEPGGNRVALGRRWAHALF